MIRFVLKVVIIGVGKRHGISAELKFDIQMMSILRLLFLIVLVSCFPFSSLFFSPQKTRSDLSRDPHCCKTDIRIFARNGARGHSGADYPVAHHGRIRKWSQISAKQLL